MTEEFIVKVEIPEGMSKKEMGQFIRSAMVNWRLNFFKDEPQRHINTKTLSVKRVQK